MFLKQDERLARVAENHSNDAMIDRVAGRYGVNIDFGGSQGVADPGQSSGTVIEKEC